jgi:hypothetical protein
MIAIDNSTKHESTKAMMFFLLKRIDYSKSWERIEYDLGYDLGDYSFENKECYKKVRALAKHIWVELNGFIDENGNVC